MITILKWALAAIYILIVIFGGVNVEMCMRNESEFKIILSIIFYFALLGFGGMALICVLLY